MRKIAGIVIGLIGVASLVVGGIFIQQSFAVKSQIMDAIIAQRITSGSQQQQFVLNPAAVTNAPTVPTTIAPTGTATAPVTTTAVVPPGTIVNVSDKVVGIIDTPGEVKLMANTLMAHLMADFAPYSVMKGTDPNRQTYLNGLSMVTALNEAQMGLGVSTIALGVGVFMLITGLGFGIVGIYIGRRRSNTTSS
jgi:hypothetical protein